MIDKQTCNKELLTLYHYGELGKEEQLHLEEHLECCHECRSELEEIKHSLVIIPANTLKLSAAEKHRFTGQVLNKTNRPSWHRKQVWGAGLAAAGALAITLSVIPDPQKPAEIASPTIAEFEILEQLELLQELELLEDLELLEELEDLG